ncbi:MAG: hypothetical protein KAY24_14755 [Candidatus Eisenbacteria sp.]|nr:hypothetical protein [Candidatus Eisenbacteria bacterium]
MRVLSRSRQVRPRALVVLAMVAGMLALLFPVQATSGPWGERTLTGSSANATPVPGRTATGSISIMKAAGDSLPTVTITSPTGGESWEALSINTITYEVADPDTPPDSITIALAYSTDSGGSWTDIATSQANTGFYHWTLPDVSTVQARVRVTANDGVLEGSASSGDFEILRPASQNSLSVGTASGSSGGQATIILGLLNNDVVKEFQTDISFNTSVVVFSRGEVADRGTGMSFTVTTMGDDALRVSMSCEGASYLATGAGSIASLTFDLVGVPGSQTAITPASTMLIAPEGRSLPVTAEAGSISIHTSGEETAPTMRIFVLKNPARVRTIQVFVTSDRTLDAAPTVTTELGDVVMSALDALERTYLGILHVPESNASTMLTASGTSGSQSGEASITVEF